VHDCTTNRNELAFGLGYEPDAFWQAHEEKFSRISPFWAPLQLIAIGAVNTRAMLVGDHEFFKSRYYQEWVKPQGLGDTIAVKVLHSDQRLGLLVANRIQSKPRYGEREVHLLTRLSPHVCRAVKISDALNLKTIRSGALEATLSALTIGVYLVDHLNRIIYMNQSAEHQVREKRALCIEHDHLVPLDHNACAELANAIAEAKSGEAEPPAGGITLALPDGEGAGLVATVLPLGRGERRNVWRGSAAMAAIFVQDPIAVPRFPGEAFAKLYCLTGGELRVLLAMAPGLGVKEAAEVLGISETTAKTHLQRIFAKTGTSKQTELIHLFMSWAPPIKVLEETRSRSSDR
jgi:DNA-binding CsgD family transcriptional regulator/PAS domain-containing protein